MSVESYATKTLKFPEELRPNQLLQLPSINTNTLTELSAYGWKAIGLMVGIIDFDGKVLMLEHHARTKNIEGMLGPLGETSKSSGPIVEQPLQTLYRGLKEELGTDDPNQMGLSLHKQGGWEINQWPRGLSYPGQFACAISFPIFVDDSTRNEILNLAHNGEEVGAAEFMKPSDVFDMDESKLRPGVKPWLSQLGRAGLLAANADFGGIEPVNFTDLFEASFTDIKL